MGTVLPPGSQPVQHVAIATAPPRAKRDRIDIILTVIQAVGGVALTASSAVVGYFLTYRGGISAASQNVEAKKQDVIGNGRGKLLDTALLVLKSQPKPGGQDALIRAWAFDVVNDYLSEMKLDPGTREQFIKTQLPNGVDTAGSNNPTLTLSPVPSHK